MRNLAGVLLAAVLLGACSSDDGGSDEPGGSGGTAGAAGAAGAAGGSGGGGEGGQAGGGGAQGDLAPLTKAPTTLEQTLVSRVERMSSPSKGNPSLPSVLATVPEEQGILDVKGGDAVVVRAIDDSTPPAAGAGAKQLLRYVHLSDLQLADDESPTRLGLFDNQGEPTAALRPQDPQLCRMANAAVRTINFLHGQRPIDFVLMGGDNADSAQSNEVDWVLGILNGGDVECDSGADDDLIPGPGNDGKDAFKAEGLKMPWKWVTGNHDVLVQGNVAVSAQNKKTVLGTKAVGGTRDYRIGGELAKDDLIADERRALLDRAALMARVAGSADGHGLGEAQKASGKAFYHFDVEGTPLRFVILDTGAETGGAEGVLHQADVDAYVKPALDEAKAQGKWVILASHHASGSLSEDGGAFGKPQADAILPDAWRDFLGGYDNVIFSMVGHSHQHRAIPILPPGGGHAYWEVMTSAIADFPHQFRVLELWDQDNGWLMLRATCVDLATDNDAVAEEGRRRGTIDWVSNWVADGRGADGQRNVELYIKKPGG